MVLDENMVNEYASVPASGSTANLWSNLHQATNDDLKDVKMRLLNLKNNIGTSDATHQTGDDSPSGETPDHRPKTERQLSDTSTCNSIYSGFACHISLWTLTTQISCLWELNQMFR